MYIGGLVSQIDWSYTSVKLRDGCLSSLLYTDNHLLNFWSEFRSHIFFINKEHSFRGKMRTLDEITLQDVNTILLFFTLK